MLIGACGRPFSLLGEYLHLSKGVVEPNGRRLHQVDSEELQVASIEVLELQRVIGIATYHFGADDMPVLSVTLKVRVVHQRIVFQNSLPLLLVFLVLASKLFDRYLVSIVVLEAEVRELDDLGLLLELNLNVGLARPS